jgi:hypothetical protein
MNIFCRNDAKEPIAFAVMSLTLQSTILTVRVTWFNIQNLQFDYRVYSST